MKMKYLAVALSVLAFSQTVLATAPLCRSVLRSFTQEQINASIEDFTRLTIQTDSAQASGDTSAMTRILIASKKTKEKELIESFNISRDELRKLVAARNKGDIEIATAEHKRSEEKEVLKDIINLRRFELEKHFEPNIPSSITSIHYVVNSTKLLITGSDKNVLISMADGNEKTISGTAMKVLADGIVTRRMNQSESEYWLTNFANGNETEISAFKDKPFHLSGDRKSVIQSLNSPFQFIQTDQNGVIVNRGQLDHISAEFSYAGANEWLLTLSDRTLAIFNPSTKEIKNTELQNIIGFTALSHNRVALHEISKIHILDLASHQIISKELNSPFSISFSSENSIWVKSDSTLRRLDIDTLAESHVDIDYVSNNLVATAFPEAGLVTMNKRIPGADQTHRGLYRLDDLVTPLFNSNEIYPNTNIARLHLADDGKHLFVLGLDAPSGAKFFIDVVKVEMLK